MRTVDRDYFISLFKHPNYSVLFVFAVFLVIFGILGLTPLSPFVAAVTIPSIVVKVGACSAYIISGVWTLRGFFKKDKKTIMRGSFAMFLCWLFASIVRFAYIGFSPTNWIAFFAIAIATAVCRISAEIPQR